MNSSLQFFFEPDDYFGAWREAVKAAKRSVDVEMYIFQDDAVGQPFAELLAVKAQQGLKVRVLYDSVGSREASEGLWFMLEENGVQVQEYHPFFPLPRKLRRRDHRKVLLVDSQVGFLGGFNLMAENWRDAGVRMTDPHLVGRLQTLFDYSWEGREQVLRRLSRRRRQRWGEDGIQLVPSFGVRRLNLIRQEYLGAIVHAERRIELANAYFIPDRGMLRALRRASKRGVAVRILCTGPSDVPMARWASQHNYSRLLRDGVRIFEFQPRMMHAKTAVIDGSWFTVGTANIDHLSFFHNLELNLVGRDAAAARELEAQFERDLLDSREIRLEEWEQRPAWRRRRERFWHMFRAWM
ncbi:MAG TPA: phospholipase D-like domain-containing protein [bacterium]|nr:phospholipase D-like domain-containing protein [bacterium]